jgi:glucosylceramidase
MNFFLRPLIVIGFCVTVFSCNKKPNEQKVAVWLTNIDESALFEKQLKEPAFQDIDDLSPTIIVDPSISSQKMDGFGYSLTGGSAMVINRMSSDKRIALLKELFQTDDNNIGISYLRISIGASDLDEQPFSYVEISDGETDDELTRFSQKEDRKNLIPVLKEILTINPDIKIMRSPWSAPKWMKTNNDTKGGSLKPQYFKLYADYFVKYIKSMQAEGILLDAITVQNEPLHPRNNPSMYMEAKDQADFVKNHLGTAFHEAAIKPKIIIYDHNLDRIDYPISILEDKGAAQYIDGTVFHLYGGTIEEMSKIHDAFSNINLYFNEQWVGDVDGGRAIKDIFGWHIKNFIIGAPKNWSKLVLEFNLASDESLASYAYRGGCDLCIGAITIQGDEVIRRPV